MASLSSSESLHFLFYVLKLDKGPTHHFAGNHHHVRHLAEELARDEIGLRARQLFTGQFSCRTLVAPSQTF